MALAKLWPSGLNPPFFELQIGITYEVLCKTDKNADPANFSASKWKNWSWRAYPPDLPDRD
jgi:hypothetical protein